MTLAAPDEPRGWNGSGIPTKATLQRLGLWGFLNEETRERIGELNC